MELEVKLEVEGNRARLRLFDAGNGRLLASSEWEDRRDLADRYFRKLESLLAKHGLGKKDIARVDFDCDSPYFRGELAKAPLRMEQLNSTGKCGFTAWQTGETISKVMNFALGDEA